jgi:hypothetical protein
MDACDPRRKCQCAIERYNVWTVVLMVRIPESMSAKMKPAREGRGRFTSRMQTGSRPDRDAPA